MKNWLQLSMVLGALALGACSKKGEGVSKGNCNWEVIEAYNNVARACANGGGANCAAAKAAFLNRFPDANCTAEHQESGLPVQVTAQDVADL